MLLSQFQNIRDLTHHRIVIDHHHQYKVLDVLSYNPAADTVLVEYQFRPGQNTTQTVSCQKIWRWITKAAHLENWVI